MEKQVFQMTYLEKSKRRMISKSQNGRDGDRCLVARSEADEENESRRRGKAKTHQRNVSRKNSERSITNMMVRVKAAWLVQRAFPKYLSEHP